MCENGHMEKWFDLEVLLAIEAEGSLAGAGRRLAVRHTTVARRLAALERSAGTQLVDKMPRGASLTEVGSELARTAKTIDGLMSSAARTISGRVGVVSGHVSITAPPALANDYVTPGLAPLLEEHPGLSVTVHANSNVLSLYRNETDIALRLGDPQEPSLLSRRIGTVRLGLYGTREMVDRDPAEWTFVGYDDALAHLPQHRWFEELIDGRRVAMRTNDVFAQCSAAAAGIGIAMVPCSLAQAHRDLIFVDDHRPPDRPLWLLVHPALRRSAAVDAVILHLVTVIGQSPEFVR